MSIFSKPVTQISTADLEELVAEHAVENVRLEFKREIPDRHELLKKLSSFANTFGGDLVIGATANSADGRITDLTGVDEQSGYKQSVIQYCFAGVTPPLVAEVSDPIPVPAGTGRVCYVIRTAESDLAPHFLNGRRGLYVRTDEFSGHFQPQLATENELRHLLGRRQLIFDRRAGLISRARERFLTILPRFPANPLCDHPTLIRTLRENTVAWRQVDFPRSTYGTRISQHESAIVLQPCGPRSYLEANTWGMAYYATPIGEQRDNFTGIHTNSFIGHLLVFLRHAQMLLHRLGFAGPLCCELLMQYIRNVAWISFPNGFAETGPNSELDDAVTFTLDTSTDELQDNCDRPACDLLQYVFFAMNWPSVADSREKLERLVDIGYDHNRWPPRHQH